MFEEPKDTGNGNNPEHAERQSGLQQTLIVRPWVRYFARQLDFFIFNILFVIGIIIINAEWLVYMANPWVNWLTAVLWVFPEALCLMLTGTTPGKWAFGITLRNQSGSQLTADESLARPRMVLIRGMFLGFSILAMIGNLLAYFKIKENGITSWDRDLKINVLHGTISAPRIITIIILMFFLLMMAGSGVDPEILEKTVGILNGTE